MHRQFYDSEEESEPRVTPKPVSKFDDFAVPTVPEVSLILDPRPRTGDKRGNSNLPSRRLTETGVRPPDDTAETSASPVWNDRNSYARWREQNYHRVVTPANATHDSLSYGNIHNHHHNSCVPQERDESRDRQRRSIRNTRTNDRTSEKSVKFQYPNVGDPYKPEQRTRLSPSDGRMSRNSLQRTVRGTIDRCVSDNVIPDHALKQNGHSQMSYGGCRPQFCLPGYSNYVAVDNNETVKTLLQLVNSQSEQIRNLQLQIDRLVRMQEENFRNKSACGCHSPSLVANQAYRYPPMNYYADAAVGSSLARCSGQDAKERDIGPRGTSVRPGKEDQIIVVDEGDKLETASTAEQQSKKTFMEQKVSIGVMTSFEFTVQNSPFLMEPETYERKEAPPKEDNINARSINVNVHDASDSASKRYKNTFARGKPGTAQLENIVEDSESHLSSSQQQSSNFNASSVRDSERHTPRQSDLYNATGTLESSKMYQHPAVDFNREKTHEEMYNGRKDDNADERLRNVRGGCIPLDASVNVDYSCSGSANYSKAPAVGDTTDGYTALDEEESNDKITSDARSSNCALNSSAKHRYQGHKTRERYINAKETNKDVGDSVVLSGGDLKILERPPPTPEPSIHVEMQEYISDDESDRLKRTSKIGWTFYNNVLGQVNDILQNSSMINDKDECDAKVARRVEQENDTETKRTALDTVKAATLEQLRKLGISLTENNEHGESNGNNKTLDFDSSFYPRLDRQANMIHSTSVVNDTNTSMRMKALALKYLSDEQLADVALHKQETSSLKHVLLSNMEGTNMSFATMRYLERYQLLPGKNGAQMEDPATDRMHGEVAPKAATDPYRPSVIEKNNPALRRFPFVAQSPPGGGTSCPNRILDLSTLKRQPKLFFGCIRIEGRSYALRRTGNSFREVNDNDPWPENEMITDVQLAVFCNILGVALFFLVFLFHYINANYSK